MSCMNALSSWEVDRVRGSAGLRGCPRSDEWMKAEGEILQKELCGLNSHFGFRTTLKVVTDMRNRTLLRIFPESDNRASNCTQFGKNGFDGFQCCGTLDNERCRSHWHVNQGGAAVRDRDTRIQATTVGVHE